MGELPAGAKQRGREEGGVGRIRLSDRVCRARPGAGGGGVRGALWDGDFHD